MRFFLFALLLSAVFVQSTVTGWRVRVRRVVSHVKDAVTSAGDRVQNAWDGIRGKTPEPCKVSEWSSWLRCSSTCGSGTHSRNRRIVQSAKDGGSCDYTLKETGPCNIKPCPVPVPCQVGAWSRWSGCSRSCGSGTHTRNRRIVQNAKYGGSCHYSLKETGPCKTEPCPVPVPCQVGAWSRWSGCSRSCGSGTHTRNRRIVQNAKYGGSCHYSLKETGPCNTEPCPVPVPCQVGAWSGWSGCSRTCGSGNRIRSRGIVVHAKHGGSCKNSLEESQSCEVGRRIDCQLTEWNAWNACNGSCANPGYKIRRRRISQFSQCGGKPCPPEPFEAKRCPENCCKECVVSQWSKWSQCSCFGNWSVRWRNIVNEPSMCKPCLKRLHEVKSCQSRCHFSEWGQWSACQNKEEECVGQRARKRIPLTSTVCGKTCETQTETQPCDVSIPCKLGVVGVVTL